MHYIGKSETGGSVFKVKAGGGDYFPLKDGTAVEYLRFLRYDDPRGKFNGVGWYVVKGPSPDGEVVDGPYMSKDNAAKDHGGFK